MAGIVDDVVKSVRDVFAAPPRTLIYPNLSKEQETALRTPFGA